MSNWDKMLIGTSQCFLKVTEVIPQLSRSKATVLISGETGTGKELFARAIHYYSERQGKPFVPLSCAALPDHLIENELFGHTKGAFTGALLEKHGLFHEAHGGTLFLDEINSLSLAVQSKLLRVLQDQEFRPLGSTKSQSVDVKIIAASNADLRHLIEARQFREDLFYRLNILSIILPPLRDRKEDILLLANHFMKIYAKEFGRSHITMESSAKAKLMGYAWPGNVRELQSVVQRAIAMGSGDTIDAHHFDLPESENPELILASETSAPDAIVPDHSLQSMKRKLVNEFEREYLSGLLITCNGNISKAARTAGKERRTFQRLLKKYGLERRTFVDAAEASSPQK